jgi:CRP-like cAMP-binding protein
MKYINHINPLKLVEFINRVELFKELDVAQRETLALTPGIIVSIDEGETFIKQGQFDPNLFIILSGKATVIMNKERVTEVSAGAFLGEFGFLFEEQRIASIVADCPMVAIKLNKDTFDVLDEAIQSKLKDRLMKGLVERVQHQNKLILDLMNQKS